MLALASMVYKGESVRIFDLITGEEGQRVCLRLPRGCDSIKAALYCHQNMTEEVLFSIHLSTTPTTSAKTPDECGAASPYASKPTVMPHISQLFRS